MSPSFCPSSAPACTPVDQNLPCVNLAPYRGSLGYGVHQALGCAAHHLAFLTFLLPTLGVSPSSVAFSIHHCPLLSTPTHLLTHHPFLSTPPSSRLCPTDLLSSTPACTPPLCLADSPYRIPSSLHFSLPLGHLCTVFYFPSLCHLQYLLGNHDPRV